MNHIIRMTLGYLLAAVFLSCGQNEPAGITQSGLDRRAFQTVVDGDSTDLFVLRNEAGAEVCVTNYGGRIVSLMVQDASGNLRDVVLGFDTIDEYTAGPSSFGATVGRFANRIAYGRFTLDGDTVRLDVNSGAHSIHGGHQGWQYQVFDANQPSDSTLSLFYISPDGEGGFPGTVAVEVNFRLSYDNALHIEYQAETDRKTVINMTNHSFFTLSGDPSLTVLDDVLYVRAGHFTPLGESSVPTGETWPVAGTPFDFRQPVAIGHAMARDSGHAQLQVAHGFDHNFILDTDGDPSQLAARLYSPASGIAMEVFTNEPGLQVYTGNMLDGSRVGKGQKPFGKQAAICLETQHFPDSPNKPDWPSTELAPGQRYYSVCTYRFTVGE